MAKYLTGPNKDINLVFSAGSVVYFEGDAIVNAANEGCLGGGGIDGAINSAAGDDLYDARKALPVLSPGVRCETGDAKVTVSGDLKSKFIIHAVGPSTLLYLKINKCLILYKLLPKHNQ